MMMSYKNLKKFIRMKNYIQKKLKENINKNSIDEIKLPNSIAIANFLV
jgi:hypothetical protein